MRADPDNFMDKILTTSAFWLESNEVICGNDDFVLSIAKHIIKLRECLNSNSYYKVSHWLSFSEDSEIANEYLKKQSGSADQAALVKFAIPKGIYTTGPFKHSFVIQNGTESNKLLILDAHKVILNEKNFLVKTMGSKCYNICRSYSSESWEWLVGVLDSNSSLNWAEGEILPSEYWSLKIP